MLKMRVAFEMKLKIYDQFYWLSYQPEMIE